MTNDGVEGDRCIAMRKMDSTAGQVFTNDGRIQPGLVDLEQHQPGFAQVVFVRRSQHLGQLGEMDEAFCLQIRTGKVTALPGVKPVGWFGDTINHGRHSALK